MGKDFVIIFYFLMLLISLLQCLLNQNMPLSHLYAHKISVWGSVIGTHGPGVLKCSCLNYKAFQTFVFYSLHLFFPLLGNEIPASWNKKCHWLQQNRQEDCNFPLHWAFFLPLFNQLKRWAKINFWPFLITRQLIHYLLCVAKMIVFQSIEQPFFLLIQSFGDDQLLNESQFVHTI